MSEPKFDKGKMSRFAEKDKYVNFVVKDLKSRGYSEEEALKVVYNQIISDNETAMIKAYKNS